MLLVNSIEDIKYRNVNPNAGRINLLHNIGNLLYDYKSILFGYDITEHIPEEFSHLGIKNIADAYAEFGRTTYNFKDRVSGEIVNFSYYLIQVWREIDEEYRDIFLMHEISEMQHRVIGKQSRQIAHERAVRKTEDYIERYLKPEEIKGFQKMLELLPERKNRPTNVKVFRV